MSTSIEVIGSGERSDLSLDYLRSRAPAAFASHRSERTGDHYVFISTHELVQALMDAGFHPTDARQRRSRGERLGYARHMIRFRQAGEDLRVVDCTPEIILINSHDATSAYQLRGGLYRFVCCNGLVLSLAEFAQRALELRFRGKAHFPFDAGRLLEARREADQGKDLWTVYNRVQENVICGGIAGRTAIGRRTSSRRITSIDEDLRINVALWQQAMAFIRP
jgi:hypothetical protein